MTPLELYRLLPQKNCGKCKASSCMSFAVQYLRRMNSIEECVELDDEARKRIETLVDGPGDWKERRLKELMEELLGWDLAAISGTVGGRMDGDLLSLDFLGRTIKISPRGMEPELDSMSALLVLMYLKKAGHGPVTGKWVAFRELKDGIIRSETFRSACEEQIAMMYQASPGAVVDAIAGMRGRRQDECAADLCFIVDVLPNIPFLILLTEPDEEFGADCRILLDSSATEFIDIEALLYLGIAFTNGIRAMSRAR